MKKAKKKTPPTKTTPAETAEGEAEGDTDYDSLSDYLTEDDIPDYKLQENNRSKGEQAEEIPFSDATSFYEILREQLGERDLTEHQRELAEYLIGSLDDDGLLRKSLESIGDELAIYAGINATEEELEQALKIVQDFDPPGLGARSLQECLLIQIRRKNNRIPRTPVSNGRRDHQRVLRRIHPEALGEDHQEARTGRRVLLQGTRRDHQAQSAPGCVIG